MNVSVIVPLYRGKKYVNKIISMIERNKIICSYVMECTVEIVFVNDFPDDNISEKEISYSSALDSVVIICNKVNQGIHRSRIIGLQHAKGDYILFLDQDDTISDAYFLSQLINIKDNDAILCNGIYRNNKLIYSDDIQQKKVIIKKNYLEQKNIIISPGQVLMKKTSIPKQWFVHILKENGSDDVLLWLLMFEQNCSFVTNRLTLYQHNEDGGNASLNFENMKRSVLELKCVLKSGGLLYGEELILCESALDERVRKYNEYIEILIAWDEVISLIDYECKKNDYRRIAIYGRGIIGERLCNDLMNLGINISFFIDKDAKAYICNDVETIEMDHFVQIVDVVFVTSLFDQKRILKDLSRKHNALRVRSLSDYRESMKLEGSL